MNKRKFIILSFTMINISVFAQLSIETINKKTFCTSLNGISKDSIFLGELINLNGGNEPYKYCWSCNHKVTETLEFTASDFLDDTTSADPQVKDAYSNEWIKFNIKVNDASGEQVSVDLNLRFSSFGYKDDTSHINIIQGDTAYFKDRINVGAGVSPLKYYWYPNYCISDTTNLSAQVFPLTSTTYLLYAIDSAGCVSDSIPIYYVNVLPTNHNFLQNNNANIKMEYINNEIFFTCADNDADKEKEIIIYSLNGKTLFQDVFSHSEYTLSPSFLKTKNLIIRISQNSRTIFCEKIIINTKN